MASTKDQDALRGKIELERFARFVNRIISSWFVENVSNSTLRIGEKD